MSEEKKETSAVKAASAQKKSTYKLIMDQISGIFFPIINCLTAASIIKSVVVLLAAGNVISESGGLYRILFAASDGFFYFLPFYLAYTASKQWKTDTIIALFIPVAMLYPDLVNILEKGGELSFLGLNVPNATYHSSVIPVLLAVGLLHFVEKPCDKWLPEAVRGFLKPIICCLIVLPVTFLLFGNIGNWIGDGLTAIFFGIYDFSPVFAGAFLGFFMQPLVVVGGHWSVVPVSINNIATIGFDVIMPLVGGAVYGQAGAALAMGIIRKGDKEKSRMAFQGALSAALGVTEPALFGSNVAVIRAMLSACAAGAVGGAIVGAAGTHCNAFAFPSYLTAVAFTGPGFVPFLISMAVSFVLAFIFTMAQKKWILKSLEKV